jgi:thioredoxin-related protein
MRLFILLMAMLCSTLTFAQLSSQSEPKDGNGINFFKAANWKEVIAKAKAENKMIFVDCYTTWCMPCKVMEKEIYPLQSVGEYFNANFISVKVQIDRTVADKEEIKGWYNDAKFIEKEYSIDAYPTFLFLSPEGKPLHRAAGTYPEKNFLALAKDARDPEKQSYTLAEKYNPEKMDTAELRKTALNYRRASPEFAKKLANAYYGHFTDKEILEMILRQNVSMIWLFKTDKVKQVANDYYAKLPKDQLLTKESLTQMLNYCLSSSADIGFKTFYKYPSEIEKIMVNDPERDMDWANSWVEDVVYTEEMKPVIEKAKSSNIAPDWVKVNSVITKKYNKNYAYHAILKGKQAWAGFKKKDLESFLYYAEYMDNYGIHHASAWTLNNIAWSYFESTIDTVKLNYALKWSNIAVSLEPAANWMDTYANLLYKLGKKKNAIAWEKQAVKLDPTNKELADVLEKMTKGQPTWTSENN